MVGEADWEKTERSPVEEIETLKMKMLKTFKQFEISDYLLAIDLIEKWAWSFNL